MSNAKLIAALQSFKNAAVASPAWDEASAEIDTCLAEIGFFDFEPEAIVDEISYEDGLVAVILSNGDVFNFNVETGAIVNAAQNS